MGRDNKDMGACEKYLMESDYEGKRLQIKHDSVSTKEQLVKCGILDLPVGPKIVDVGAGIGLVAEDIYTLIKHKNPKITLIDSSATRMKNASDRMKNDNAQFEFLNCDLYSMNYPDAQADFVFSRFVFEYLKDPNAAFAEIYRITKPGGTIAIADLDLNCMNHFPLDEDLELALQEIDSILSRTNKLDSKAGRKIFKMFHDKELKNISVDVRAHHCFYGQLREADLLNWVAKLEQIKTLALMGEMKFSFDFDDFSNRFIEFLKRTDRFSYTPMITVTGIK